MKNPTDKILAKAVTMRAEGAKWAEILSATGLSHSQAEFAVLRATEKRRMPATAANAKALRAEGYSFGHMAVILDVTEGKARGLFTEATNLESQGQRIGKGGRFYRHEELLYDGDLKPTGTDIPKGAKPDALRHAAKQRLVKLVAANPEAAKQVAQKYGVTLPAGKLTPAQITQLIFAEEAKRTAARKTTAKKAAKATA